MTIMKPSADKDFLIEEYKNVKMRIETHERHYYQMLVLSVTAMAAIFGLSDKLPDQIVPFITSSVLFVTTAVAVTQKIHQSFDTAFLLERFESKKLLSFEHTYYSIFVDSSNHKPKLRNILLQPLYRAHNPFVALVGVSFLGSLFFGYEFVTIAFGNSQYWLITLYIGILLILHLLSLHNMHRAKRLNTDYYRVLCRKNGVNIEQ